MSAARDVCVYTAAFLTGLDLSEQQRSTARSKKHGAVQGGADLAKARGNVRDAEADALASLGEFLVVVPDKIVHLDADVADLLGEGASGDNELCQCIGAGLAGVDRGPGGHFLEWCHEVRHDVGDACKI